MGFWHLGALRPSLVTSWSQEVGNALCGRGTLAGSVTDPSPADVGDPS